MTLWGSHGTYEEWVEFLDGWAQGQPLDPASLPVFDPEAFTADTRVRLTNRVTEAISARLQLWADVLGRELSAPGDEFGAERALVHGRAMLRPVRGLAASDRFPPELREQLLRLVDDQIVKTQQNLLTQLDGMRRSGADERAVEERRRTYLRTPLSAVTGEDAALFQPSAPPAAADVTGPARRRIIID